MKLRLAALILLVGLTPAQASGELHYGPLENLERLDLVRLNAARKSIDMTAFVLTDPAIIGALTASAYRGVRVRLFVDYNQAGTPAMAPEGVLGQLYKAPNVSIRAKRTTTAAMAMKSYCVDGRVFRTGSANFTAASLKQQASDLLIFDDQGLCSDFTINFDQLWDSADAE